MMNLCYLQQANLRKIKSPKELGEKKQKLKNLKTRNQILMCLTILYFQMICIHEEDLKNVKINLVDPLARVTEKFKNLKMMRILHLKILMKMKSIRFFNISMRSIKETQTISQKIKG